MVNFSSLLTPFGVRDYTPQDIRDRDKLVHILKDVFKQFGYERVATPTFEYFDAIKKGLGQTLSNQCVTFHDPSGRLLALRPDHTAPIARMVANRYTKADLPICLSYIDPIFRRDPLHGELEQFQAGVECIGNSSIEADAQVILICIEILEACGIQNFGIDIGHLEYLLPYSDCEKQAMLRGDFTRLSTLPKRGGVELVKGISLLESLYEIIKSQGKSQYISFNTGLIKDESYYSGLVFDVYVKGYGRKVAVGGRYDQLIQNFGPQFPAVGFGLDVNCLGDLCQ